MTCCNLEASVGDLVVVLQATVLLLYAHFPKIKICLDVFHPEFQIAGGRLNGCCGIYSSAKESINETKLLPQILTTFYFLLLAQELAWDWCGGLDTAHVPELNTSEKIFSTNEPLHQPPCCCPP